MLDVETANDISDALFYDCGFAVVDKRGIVYESGLFVNSDIFIHEPELMKNAFYANRIPFYQEAIQSGRAKLLNTYDIQMTLHGVINRWEIKYACAHNANFDRRALNRTKSYVTKSQFKRFFPFDLTWWDSMRMAQDVICKMPTYKKWCKAHDMARPSKSAENLYRFISGNDNFQESHIGLDDVMIEKEILAYCYRQKKAMRKELFTNKNEFPPRTEFQRQLAISLREQPTIRMEV